MVVVNAQRVLALLVAVCCVASSVQGAEVNVALGATVTLDGYNGRGFSGA